MWPIFTDRRNRDGKRFKFRKTRGLHRYLHSEIGTVFTKESAAHRHDGARMTADGLSTSR